MSSPGMLIPQVCAQAWDISLPAIARAAEKGTTNKFAGTIVVLDPYTGEVLFQDVINPDAPNAELYTEIALAKARVSWETGLPSRHVQQDAPHLYRKGMTKWGGSAVENKLVVAFSGVQQEFDEAISWMVLNWIISICQHEMVMQGGVMDSESAYI